MSIFEEANSFNASTLSRSSPYSSGSSVRFPYESYQRVFNVGFRVVVEGVRDGDFRLEPVAPVVAPLMQAARKESGAPADVVTARTAHSRAEGGRRDS